MCWGGNSAMVCPSIVSTMSCRFRTAFFDGSGNSETRLQLHVGVVQGWIGLGVQLIHQCLLVAAKDTCDICWSSDWPLETKLEGS